MQRSPIKSPSNKDSKQSKTAQKSFKRTRSHDEPDWYNDLKGFRAEFLKFLNTFRDEMTSKLSNIENQFQKSIDFLTSRYEDMTQKVNTFDDRIKGQDVHIRLLEGKIEDLSRSLQVSHIEIRNVPLKDNETKKDLTSYVSNISKTLQLETIELRDIYRLPGRKDGNPTIIAELSNHSMKFNLLKATKVYNMNHPSNKLNASHLGFSNNMTSPIFFGEHLTAKARRLYYLGRQLVKTKTHRFCWTANGKVFVRKSETSPTIQLRDEEQIDHLKFLLTLGWLTNIGLWSLVIWSGIDSGSTQYRYNATFAAQYATIAPIASAMAIAWVIYAVHSGTCDFLSRVLCWRPLVFISRLSYALYLCQFIIFITNIGTVRTSREFTLMSLIDVQEISAILLSSIILTVTFVIPMQSLHKIFSFEWKSNSAEADKENAGSESKDGKDPKTDEKKEVTPPTRSRHNLVAHREVLEEIPEVEVEYETQREHTEGLDEIIEEEEEGTIGEDDDQIDDLEIIEEEEAGEEEEREGERSQSRGDDQDLDEWEWTANGRSGAQYYRYAR